MNISKSVSVKGNLKNGKLVYTCYPTNEFSSGKWKLAIQSVVFDSAQTIASTCMITSNFSSSQKRSGTGEVTVYQEPLNTFHLKTSPAATRGIFRFGKMIALAILTFIAIKTYN